MTPTTHNWLWRLWQACWLAAVAAIFINGAIVRFTLPQWPAIAPDSYLYLTPSINGGSYNIGPRMFSYPMFCRAVLRLAGDWRALVFVQHLLGLIGPLLLLVAWFYLGWRLWSSRLARGLHATIGLALPLLLVPSTVYIIYEQQILLESVNAFLQCCLGALLCLLWLPSSAGKRRWLSAATAGFGVLMYYGNPRWGGATLLVGALALAAAHVGQSRLRGWLRSSWPVIAISALTYFSLGLVQSRVVAGDAWNNTFTIKSIFWMHADLVANEFRRDLSAPTPPSNAALLRKLLAKIDKEIVGVGVSHWVQLPFNCNDLMYIPDNADSNLIAAFPNDPEGYRRFCLRYYLRIIWHQPTAYFGEVGRMMLYYYDAPNQDGAFREIAASVPSMLQSAVPIVRELSQDAVPRQRKQLQEAADTMARFTVPVIFWTPHWLDLAVQALHRLFLPLTIVGVVGSTLILLRARWRRRRPLAILAWICLGAALVLFAQVLTLAMVTVTDGRYADALRTLAVYSLTCTIALLAGVVLEICSALTSPSPANGGLPAHGNAP